MTAYTNNGRMKELAKGIGIEYTDEMHADWRKTLKDNNLKVKSIKYMYKEIGKIVYGNYGDFEKKSINQANAVRKWKKANEKELQLLNAYVAAFKEICSNAGYCDVNVKTDLAVTMYRKPPELVCSISRGYYNTVSFSL